MSRPSIAAEEWPIVFLAAGWGVLWTLVSLAWVFVFTSDASFAVLGADDWPRVALALPAFVFLVVGESIYRAGLPLAEQLGIVAGASVAALLWIVVLLSLARRA